MPMQPRPMADTCNPARPRRRCSISPQCAVPRSRASRIFLMRESASGHANPVSNPIGLGAHMKFGQFVQLVAIGLQARIPMHSTGCPGVGKTEFTKGLETGFARAGIKCKVIILIGSIREPQDFGGFPVSTAEGV